MKSPMLKLDIILVRKETKVSKGLFASASKSYLTKLAFRSQSLLLMVLAERIEPFTSGSILLLSGT